mmetsp:Transcript_43654/g.95131  ORF Transcript_43654/g.95131 Transcript_43654/m.95131 type:complete len:117 (-) Transcript_43654:218-568(-)
MNAPGEDRSLAAFLTREALIHRTCGMSRALLPRMKQASPEGMEELCRALSETAMASVYVGRAMGPPSAGVTVDGSDRVIYFVLDPLDVDCKQVSFLPRGQESALEQLYKLECGAME